MAKIEKDITLILAEALEKNTAQEQAAYLDSVCGDDTAVRREVESLLQVDNRLGDFLENTVDDLDITLDSLSVMEGPGTVIGRYHLLEKIGEGGMAVVYMAQQEQPIRRNIAFKIIKLGMDTRQVITRFEAERQALALMDHPNIAKVLDAGSTDTGRPYFVMELVNGVPITRYCDKNKLNTRERLHLFISVCQAVQHAHQKGLIHRDLKPSNILVTFHESRPEPKVIDFGIAKATQDQLTENAHRTRLQTLVGTPAYMSPEQTQISGGDIDTRTDIYSLGVVLYEMLTGAPPFDVEALLKTGLDRCRRVIREREPERPSTRIAHLNRAEARAMVTSHRTDPGKLVRILRSDLDWIVMKCLEKERSRRYESVHSLTLDIQRYLDGEPVLARSPSMAYRTWKFVRRHKALVAMVLILILSVVVSSWQAVRATRAERAQHRLRTVAQVAQENESLQRQEAEKEGLAALRQAYNSEMNLAQQALSTHNYGRTVALLDRHRPRPNKPDLRQWEWRYFWNQSRSEASFTLAPHVDYIVRTMICPDGRYLLSTDKQGILKLWDFTEQRVVLALSEPGFDASAFTFSRDGARLALTIHDGQGGSRVNVWAIASHQIVTEFTHPRRIQAMTFAQDDSALLILDRDMGLHAWDFEVSLLQAQWPERPESSLQSRRAVFSLDGKSIAMIDQTRRIRVFDVLTGAEKMQMDAFEGDIASLAFSPDGTLLAVSPLWTAISTDIKVFSTESGAEQAVLAGHGSWVSSLTFTPDGERLISSSADQTIRIWHVDDARELTRLHGHLSSVFSVAVSPDGKRLVSGCKDGTVFGWDLEHIKHKTQFETLPVSIRSIDFLPASHEILSVNRDGTVTLWDSETLQEKESLTVLGHEIRRLLISPDSKRLIASTQRGELKVLDLASRQVVKDMAWDPNHSARSDLIGFTDQGRTLVMMTAHSEIRLFDTASWQAKSVRVLPNARPNAPVPILSHDEHFLLYVGHNETLNLMDLRNGTTETMMTHQTWSVLDMAFSPNSSLFATSSGEGTVSLYDGESREAIDVLRGHLMGVIAVAFSADGQRLASGSKSEEAIKLWDITTRHEVATLPGEGLLSSHLKFSPDGRLLGAVNSKGKAHIWRAPSLREIDEAEEGNINENGFGRR